MTTNIEIYCYEDDELDLEQEIRDDINAWSIGLWFDDCDQAGVEKVYLAWDDNDIVAFQTVNSSNETVAIEVKESYKGKGISFQLVEESGSYYPERNENPEFWSYVAECFCY
jgi:GNAT superfamily N-acetyltransferase